MGKIYITSDTHFGHDNDIIWRPRGFNSVDEMNEEIIKRWNSIITYEDTVYLLGDVMLGNPKVGVNCLRRLNGKIYILTGNHDTTNRIMEYVNIRPDILSIGYATVLTYGKYKFYLSHYPTMTSNYDQDKPLTRRIIGLCGHRHTKDPYIDLGKDIIYHCELDAHDCYPVLLDNIIHDIERKIKNE